jgi:hypothetical protein
MPRDRSGGRAQREDHARGSIDGQVRRTVERIDGDQQWSARSDQSDGRRLLRRHGGDRGIGHRGQDHVVRGEVASGQHRPTNHRGHLRPGSGEDLHGPCDGNPGSVARSPLGEASTQIGLIGLIGSIGSGGDHPANVQHPTGKAKMKALCSDEMKTMLTRCVT